MVEGSPGLRIGFVALTALLGLGFVVAAGRVGSRPGEGVGRRWALRAAAGAIGWIGGTGALAAAGALRFDPFPPTIVAVLVLSLLLVVALVRSELGRQLATGLPLALLVGYQAFRILVELLLHRAYLEGLMPVQMSYSGLNFDILSGIGAAVVGLWVWRTGERAARKLVAVWNLASLALLINIVTIAILSSPLPIRRFHNEPSNSWITAWPWVWLPAVMVVMALLGHGLVFRRLAATRAVGPAASGAPSRAAG